MANKFETFTGDGSTKEFRLNFTVSNADVIEVTLDGEVQMSKAYDIVFTHQNGREAERNTTVRFHQAPGSGVAIVITRSKHHTDTYLVRDENLGDLQDFDEAREHLDVYTTEQVNQAVADGDAAVRAAALLKDQNLLDVLDKPLARQNLGVYAKEDVFTQAETTARIAEGDDAVRAAALLKDQNLQDLQDKPLARTSLDVFSKAEVDAKIRIRLAAPLTLYVSPTGSDSNDGLTPAKAFQTIQKAWDTVQQSYDLNGYVVTIQLADGTYTQGLVAKGACIGQAGVERIIIRGNSAAPANVIVSTTGASAFRIWEGARVTLQDMKIQTQTVGRCISCEFGSIVRFGNLVFGPAEYHILSYANSTVYAFSSYTIAGGAKAHWWCDPKGFIRVQDVQVTLTGTPDFALGFAYANIHGDIYAPNIVFNGSATGPRFKLSGYSVLSTAASLSYLPGSVDGTLTNSLYA